MIAKRINSSNDNIDVGANSKIKGILLIGGSDVATLTIFNSLTQEAGKEVAVLKSPANDCRSIIFDGEGVIAGVGISVTIAGTSPDAYIYLE